MGNRAQKIILAVSLGLVLIQSAVVFRLTDRVARIEANIGTTPAAPLPLQSDLVAIQARVDAATTPEERAIAEVEQALVELASLSLQAHTEAGTLVTLAPAPSAIPTSVTVLSNFTDPADPSSFCIEVAHNELAGIRRRYLSLTGRIDVGVCRSDIPFEDQIEPNPVVTSGGHWVISNVYVFKKGVPPDSPTLGKQYVLAFDAYWVGFHDPVPQTCTYEFFNRSGKSVYSRAWGWSTFEKRVEGMEGPAVFQHFQLEGGSVDTAEMQCKNRY